MRDSRVKEGLYFLFFIKQICQGLPPGIDGSSFLRALNQCAALRKQADTNKQHKIETNSAFWKSDIQLGQALATDWCYLGQQREELGQRGATVSQGSLGLLSNLALGPWSARNELAPQLCYLSHLKLFSGTRS